MIEFQDRKPVPVAILGATGQVGQKFVELLSNHPWFHIVALTASERSIGKKYRDAAQWRMKTPLSEEIADMDVVTPNPNIDCCLAFSALDADVAGDIESDFAKAGKIVVSNARSHRYEPDVPLIVPEVNANHLDLLSRQSYKPGGIVTNPNCVVIPLSMALKPLQDAFGISAVDVTTFQAISGAVFVATTTMNIEDNIIPYIADEEEKIQKEFSKIMDLQCPISAQCHRVPVSDGHFLSVGVTLKEKPDLKEVISCWNGYSPEIQSLQLPMSPQKPLNYFEENDYPQPKLHRDLDKGMTVSIGRLRTCPNMDFKFCVLGHNIIRGAAGGAVLTAELMLRNGQIFW